MRDWTENQIELALIRHGATKSNIERRYIGKTDESLCQEGISVLDKAKSAETYPDAEYVFSGPMKRCLETAGILYPEKMPIVIPEWEEMDFGAFEGKNYMELKGDKRYQEWIDSYGTLPFPEGESRDDFSHRCDMGFRKMVELVLQSEELDSCGCITVAAIVHGGTIMALLSQYGGGDYFDYQVPNGEGYRCQFQLRRKDLIQGRKRPNGHPCHDAEQSWYNGNGAPEMDIADFQIVGIRKI